MLARRTAAFTLALSVMLTATSYAQHRDALPRPAAEVQTGWVGFVDETSIDHAAFGGAARVFVTPRLSLGPEVAYLRGPGGDSDVMVTGNLTFDFVRPRGGRPPRVTPFLIIGGGFERHRDQIGPASFSSSEGALTGGGGVRIWFNDKVYGVVDSRIGWEPHLRVTGGIGVTLR